MLGFLDVRMEGSIYATKSGDDDHVAAIRKLQRALMTTVFDAAGKGSAMKLVILLPLCHFENR
jgi:hypothetical protein